MSGNMESLLMGGDSSSGESDDESTPPNNAAAAPAPVAAKVAAPSPATAAAPAGGGGGGGAADDMKARLKSLYSASKATAVGGGTTIPPPKPSQPQPPQQPQQHLPPPQQQPQYQQQPPPPPQHHRPQYQQPPPQQQQQQPRPMQQNYQQPPPQQHPQTQAPRQSYPPPQQSRPSSQSMRPPPQRPPQQQQQHHMQQRQQHPQQQMQQQQTQGHRSSQPPPQQQQQQQHHGQSSSSSRPDPFAPTPLSQIQNRAQGRMSHPQQQQPPPPQQQHAQPQQQHPQQQQQQQQQQQLPMGTSTSRPSGGSSGSGRDMSEQEKREIMHRKQKEKFLMFTRVLIKYLEGKDANLHTKAKLVIKDCAERNKRGEPGYESVTMAMQRRLKDLVGETYWKKAQEFLYYMHQKRKQQLLLQQQQQQQQQGDATQSPRVGPDGASQKIQLPSNMTEEQKRRYIEQKRKQQAVLAKAKGSTLTIDKTLDKMRQELHEKREQIEMQTSPQPGRPLDKDVGKGEPIATVGSPSAAAPLPTVTKGKKGQRRKSDGSAKTTRKAAASTAKATPPAPAAPVPAPVKVVMPVAKPILVEPTREYEELMELIDHAVDYDWPSIGQLLGDQKDLNLSEEERQLLYGDASPMPVPVTTADQADGTQMMELEDEQPTETEEQQDASPGSSWGTKNVLSVRAAWARLRLGEVKRNEKARTTGAAPVVAGGLLTLPSDPGKLPSPSSAPTEGSEATAAEGGWVNEEIAEKDPALALLSNGCQIYLQGVLEKAMQCARQRQNLDGIRLWHQQYAANEEEESKPAEKATDDADKEKDEPENAETSEDKKTENNDQSKGQPPVSAEANVDSSKKEDKPKIKPPPLLLRLGCDVSRQIAQAQGNAALTVKRMEEALERQPGVPSSARKLSPETLAAATSMNDLSWRPLLKEGAKKADYEAKRSFEIYGGKESKDPPLGRVPKKAKLVVEDFIMGSKLVTEGKQQRAYTASAFIFF